MTDQPSRLDKLTAVQCDYPPLAIIRLNLLAFMQPHYPEWQDTFSQKSHLPHGLALVEGQPLTPLALSPIALAACQPIVAAYELKQHAAEQANTASPNKATESSNNSAPGSAPSGLVAKLKSWLPSNTPTAKPAPKLATDEATPATPLLGTITPRAALFGLTLLSQLTDYQETLLLMSQLLAHADPSIQQQLDTLSLTARYILLCQLINQADSTVEAPEYDLTGQPYEPAVATLAEQSGYILSNPWQDGELVQALWLIYPEFKARLLPKVWADMWLRTFQTGWERRSFRLLGDDYLLVQQALEVMRTCTAYPYGNDKFYNPSLLDSVRYVNDFGYQPGIHPYLLAAALDTDDSPINFYGMTADNKAVDKAAFFEMCHDIVYQEDEFGLVSRELIKGLLSSNNPATWQLVAKLMLAAQRQEGLRQTIIECLDEAHPDAIPFMIALILDHDLIRFSAVVRGLDVWTGLNWTAERASAVKKHLAIALAAFKVANPILANSDLPDTTLANTAANPTTPTDTTRASTTALVLTRPILAARIERLHQAMPAWLSSRDHSQIYMGLWVLGCHDAAQTLPHLKTLITDKVADRACLALHFATQLKLYAAVLPLYYQASLRNEPKVLAYSLEPLARLLSDQSHAQQLSYEQRRELFTHCQALLAQYGNKYEKTFSDNVFSGISAQFISETLYEVLINIAVIDDEYLPTLVAQIDEMPVNKREQLTRLMLPAYYRYYYSQDKEESKTPPTAAQRHFAMQMLTDRSEMIHLASTETLIACSELEPEELDTLIDLLSKKTSALKKRILRLLLAQPDEGLSRSVTTLLTSANSQQRVAGLELLWHLLVSSKPTLRQQAIGWLADYEQQDHKRVKAETEQWHSCQEKATESHSERLSSKNGWGLFDPANLHSSDLPPLNQNSIYYQLTQHASATHGFSKPILQINADLEALQQLYLAHHDFEYTREYYDGSRETALLANGLYPLNLNLTLPEELAAAIGDDTENSLEVENQSTKCQTLKEQAQQKWQRLQFENYPLYEVWEQWYDEVNWQPTDLFLVSLLNEMQPQYESISVPSVQNVFTQLLGGKQLVIPNVNKSRWHNPVREIVDILTLIQPFSEKNAYFIGLTIEFFTLLPQEILSRNLKQEPLEQQQYHYHYGDIVGWQSDDLLMTFINKINIDSLEDIQVAPVWQLWRWQQFAGLPQDIQYTQPPLKLAAKAYQQGLINADELMAIILLTGSAISDIQGREYRSHRRSEDDWATAYPFLAQFVQRIIASTLAIELKRGELETPMSDFAKRIVRIADSSADSDNGVDNQAATVNVIDVLVQLLKGLENTGFYANYIYNYSDMNKKAMFSQLTTACRPTAFAVSSTVSSDVNSSANFEPTWQARFNAAMSEAAFKDSLLVALAMYAPQWQTLVERYLEWPGLTSGIQWMRAHTKTSDYVAQNANDESDIARYSTIELTDFQRGAVDIVWFQEAYSQLGRQRWEMIYDSAKYISEGNGHRRAKLYSDVLTGDLKIRAVSAKVKDKRDQDYVRLYGLVPLSKTNPDKDILTRYHTLMQFKKDSRQFGSQRQQSEGQAVEVALENLARNAGFSDPQRLTWAMETQTVQAILAGNTEMVDGDVRIALCIDDLGKSHIDLRRGDKALKSIPAQYKKDQQVLALQAHKKTLNEQFKRARHSLEMAMVHGDKFRLHELETLFAHPVISKHLANLVFVIDSPDVTNADTGTGTEPTRITPEQIGFYHPASVDHKAHLYRPMTQKDNAAQPINDSKATTLQTELVDSDELTLRIAYCYDLQAAGVWSDYQHYCFAQQIVQPFKQIFRELYVPTPDELAAESVSKRYAGHQVQPAKTVALLKSRGWRADYEEGLQKVNHQLGFRVKIYAMADWFTPADVEAPTLETLVFEDLTTGKPLPFTAIDPRAFSEAMRDIDLVVSVAHVGGVDVAASQSSIELRAALLTESMRLFKQDNVEVKGQHALIEGARGKYSVHLGSAVVHQIPGSYLSILPVHSQHRGKIFLPFMDEDPKTAEIISKVLLLARDNKIQDPTILQQLR